MEAARTLHDAECPVDAETEVALLFGGGSVEDGVVAPGSEPHTRRDLRPRVEREENEQAAKRTTSARLDVGLQHVRANLKMSVSGRSKTLVASCQLDRHRTRT